MAETDRMNDDNEPSAETRADHTAIARLRRNDVDGAIALAKSVIAAGRFTPAFARQLGKMMDHGSPALQQYMARLAELRGTR